MIIRIDDFPTGVRPVLPQKELLPILDAFEKAGIIIHLAVVPKLVEKMDCPKHSNIIAIQHGYHHRYHEMSKKLMEAGDPYNAKTIGVFDEFPTESPEKIAAKLKEGWFIIKRKFKNNARWFVPVCNLINHNLAEALKIVNYEKILSERGENVIKSDQYCRLHEIDYSKKPQIITLHLTWEHDILREKGINYWMEGLEKLENYYHNGSEKPAKSYKKNNDYHILFKFPTRMRPEKFFRTLRTYYENISQDNFTFHINMDCDDKSMNNEKVREKLERFKNLTYTYDDNKTKIEACNAPISYNPPWDIVVLVSDDMIPVVRGFDTIIRQKMREFYPDTDGILFFNDGNQQMDVNTFSIMGRKFYERFGYMYHPDYKTICCDSELTIIGFALRKQEYFQKVIVEHRHPVYGKAGFDQLYLRNCRNELNVHDGNILIKRRNYGFPRCSVKDFEEYIPKTAFFYWNKETPMSYLRYLTLVTFRYHHPDWGMVLYVSGSNTKKQWTGIEDQDFVNHGQKNYLDEVYKLNCQIKDFETYQLNPNYISDVFRWKILAEFGGWYFDLDQIFTGNFDKYRDLDFVYGCQKHQYSGVLGASKKSKVAAGMKQEIDEKLKRPLTSYCELGNWLFSEKFHKYSGKERVLRTINSTFYPITDSYNAKTLYNGSFKIDPDMSDAVHWFGGHPESQAFNRIYTEDFAKKSKDSISSYLESLKLI